MDDPDRLLARLHALEGRMIAHRRILQRLLAEIPMDQRAAMAEWLEARTVMHDGQEDPGAVPAEAAALELALADEMRRLHEALTDAPINLS